jgi:hypothetical protein
MDYVCNSAASGTPPSAIAIETEGKQREIKSKTSCL